METANEGLAAGKGLLSSPIFCSKSFSPSCSSTHTRKDMENPYLFLCEYESSLEERSKFKWKIAGRKNEETPPLLLFCS